MYFDTNESYLSLYTQIQNTRRLKKASIDSYNILLVLYIIIIVLGGCGNMVIIIACFRNKVF